MFEREFATMLGARYAVAVNSCSSGLYLSLLACGVSPGDEVLVPAFTFIAVPSAVVHAQAQPVLVEMTDDYAVDPDDLERKITPRTKALLLSYMRGYAPELERVVDICDRHGIALIEDVAHGLGETWNDVPLGRFGRVAAYSFQSYKLLDGGEGGMVVTDDRDIALNTILRAGCYDRTWQCHFLDDDDRAWLERSVNSLPAYAMRMSNLTASVPVAATRHDRRSRSRTRRAVRSAARRTVGCRHPVRRASVPAPTGTRLAAVRAHVVVARTSACVRRGLSRSGASVAGLRHRPDQRQMLLELEVLHVTRVPADASAVVAHRRHAAAAVVDASMLDYFADSIQASLREARAAS